MQFLLLGQNMSKSEAFWRKKLKEVNYFCAKAPTIKFDMVLNSSVAVTLRKIRYTEGIPSGSKI